MSRAWKITLGIVFLLLASFLCVGYAKLTGHLQLDGSVEVIPPNYDEIVITNIQTVSGANTATETHSRVVPTNVQSKITGDAGDTVVYKITAHNYSETVTYVYTGILWGDDYASVANKMTMSASLDADGAQPLPNTPNAVSVQGTPVAPGEEIEFYAVYTLKSGMAAEELLVRFAFEPVLYSVTYLDANEVYAIDYIVDNSVPYTVRTEDPDPANQLEFAGWVNANADIVHSYPAGNTNDYTLSAKWDNMYLIIFVDEFGNVLYEETFTDTSKKNGLSATGQAIVDEKLAELAEIAAVDEMSVVWSDYDIKNATSDITVRPIYTYTGNLRFTPIDEDGDGITDYYQVDAVAALNNPTKIPGRFKGLDVRTVNKLYLNEDNFDYGAGVQTIEVGEGVQVLNRNSLAYTSSLTTVKLPSTLKTIGKNAFSRNFGNDKKVLTIEYNGTMAEWQTLIQNSHSDWHNGLRTGSVVKCSDGYFTLDRGFLELGGYKWTAHSY